MQSLIVSLNFCTRAISSARAFSRRFCDSTVGIRKPHHFIRVTCTKSIEDDLATWVIFLESFNGVCYFKETDWSSSDSLQLFTDSAGGKNLGCGAYFQGHWVFFPWPVKWLDCDVRKNMTFLELVQLF